MLIKIILSLFIYTKTSVNSQFITSISPLSVSLSSGITERERNVLKLVADGHSNTEIAEELIISQNTVKNHIASLLSKLAVKDRTQIAVFALKNNLLS